MAAGDTTVRPTPYAMIDLLGDGSSLSVRSSHPYEDGIYVFVQPIRGAKGNLLGYSLAVTGTTSLTLLSGAMADIRPEARVAVGVLLARLAARSGDAVFLLQHLLHFRCNGNAELSLRFGREM